MKIARINIILRRYRSTDALCRFLNTLPDSVWPSSIKSRISLILGVSRYVLIKKLIATLIPSAIPKTNSPKAKNKNIKIETKKQKFHIIDKTENAIKSLIEKATSTKN